jgi:hypothetical protein
MEVDSLLDCIQLAACDVDESLPTNPILPADLFTGIMGTCVFLTPGLLTNGNAQHV